MKTQMTLESIAERIADPRFEPIKTITLTVPKSYRSNKQLFIFGELHKSELSYMHEAFSREDFPRPSHPLVPGRKYMVTFISIVRRVQPKHCMAVYKKLDALFVGAPGASLVYQLAKSELPKGRWSHFFDQKTNLMRLDGNYYVVPCMQATNEGRFVFNLDSYQMTFDRSTCLVCFHEVKRKSKTSA